MSSDEYAFDGRGNPIEIADPITGDSRPMTRAEADERGRLAAAEADVEKRDGPASPDDLDRLTRRMAALRERRDAEEHERE